MHNDQANIYFEIIFSILFLFVFTGGLFFLVFLLPKRIRVNRDPDSYQEKKAIEEKKKKKKQSLSRRAKHAAKSGGLKQAEGFLYQASGIDENDPRILEELSEVLYKQNKLDKRLLVLQKLTQVDPSNIQICFLGNALLEYPANNNSMEYIQKAEDCFSFVLEKSSENTTALLGLAKTAIKKEEFEVAFSYLKKAYQIDQSDREINFLLLFLYKEFGHTNSLSHHLSMMRLRFSMDPEFLEEEILHSFEIKEYHTAITAYENYLKIEGDSYAYSEGTLKKVALAYYYLSDYDHSIDLYHDLITAYPEKEDYHYNIALAYVKKMMYKEAIEHIKICIKMNPKDVRFQMLLGKLADEIGDYDLAQSSYEEVLRIDPSNISLLRDLKRG